MSPSIHWKGFSQPLDWENHMEAYKPGTTDFSFSLQSAYKTLWGQIFKTSLEK